MAFFEDPVIYGITIMIAVTYITMRCLFAASWHDSGHTIIDMAIRIVLLFLIVLFASHHPGLSIVFIVAFFVTVAPAMSGVLVSSTNAAMPNSTGAHSRRTVPSSNEYVHSDSTSSVVRAPDSLRGWFPTPLGAPLGGGKPPLKGDGTAYEISKDTEIGLPLHSDFQHSGPQALGEPLAGYDSSADGLFDLSLDQKNDGLIPIGAEM